MNTVLNKKHVVIVGGGFAGLRVARKLASTDVEVTLVDRRNHHLFQPLLYQVATAGLSPEDIAIPLRRAVREAGNIDVLMAEVTKVDMNHRRLSLNTGDDLTYDYLVLAAGAVPNYHGHDEWQPRAPSLKNLSEALRVRERVLLAVERAELESNIDRRKRLLSFAVIGAGPTGVELAGALAELSRLAIANECKRVSADMITVNLVEMGNRVLPGFEPSTSTAAQGMLEELGIQVRLDTRVTGIERGLVKHTEGLLQAEHIVWASGVKTAPLAQQIDAEVGKQGRVIVAQDCSLPDHPEVFVLGDMASFQMTEQDAPLPALAAVAVQQGSHAAKAIICDLHRKPRQAFSYRDRGRLATVGRGRAVADLGRFHLAGATAWWLWSLVHIYQLIGVRNRANVLLDWAFQYFTSRRRAGKRILIGNSQPLPSFSEPAEMRGLTLEHSHSSASPKGLEKQARTGSLP